MLPAARPNAFAATERPQQIAESSALLHHDGQGHGAEAHAVCEGSLRMPPSLWAPQPAEFTGRCHKVVTSVHTHAGDCASAGAHCWNHSAVGQGQTHHMPGHSRALPWGGPTCWRAGTPHAWPQQGPAIGGWARGGNLLEGRKQRLCCLHHCTSEWWLRRTLPNLR